MPSIAKDQKEFYKPKIRALIAIDHGISRRNRQVSFGQVLGRINLISAWRAMMTCAMG
jgi:hypothetical protein